MNIITFLEQELDIRGKPAPTGWYRACCPIHHESSPSFAVNTHHPYNYNCLACGAHGSLPDLVAKLKKMAFKRAVEYIRDRLFITPAEMQALLQPPPEIDPYVSSAAITAFREALPNSRGLSYCRERGVPRYVLELYRVGYEEADDNLLIPLWALPGLKEAVGFEMRHFDVDGIMKSVDVSPGWRKKSIVCPVGQHYEENGVIVSEGFFDAARITQWLCETGRLNKYVSVAICGNKLSQHHAVFLSQFDRICLGFDNDRGGETAIEQAYRLMPERSFQRLIFAGKDPGESESFSIVML